MNTHASRLITEATFGNTQAAFMQAWWAVRA